MRVYYVVHYQDDGFATYGSITAKTDAQGNEPCCVEAIAHTFGMIPQHGGARPSFAVEVFLH